jgi:hypothetical protein
MLGKVGKVLAPGISVTKKKKFFNLAGRLAS